MDTVWHCTLGLETLFRTLGRWCCFFWVQVQEIAFEQEQMDRSHKMVPSVLCFLVTTAQEFLAPFWNQVSHETCGDLYCAGAFCVCFWSLVRFVWTGARLQAFFFICVAGAVYCAPCSNVGRRGCEKCWRSFSCEVQYLGQHLVNFDDVFKWHVLVTSTY